MNYIHVIEFKGVTIMGFASTDEAQKFMDRAETEMVDVDRVMAFGDQYLTEDGKLPIFDSADEAFAAFDALTVTA